jgi:hypothetical protein
VHTHLTWLPARLLVPLLAFAAWLFGVRNFECGRVWLCVSQVGAGDSFLAGVVAALCHFSSSGCSSPPEERPLSLSRLLQVGAASSMFKVDTGRSGGCPTITVLLEQIKELTPLPLDSARLQA